MPIIEEPTMPFTGHEAKQLYKVLESIFNSPMPVELFDAFLAEYKRSGNLSEARHFAACEWDC